jgi:hypothetical protein
MPVGARFFVASVHTGMRGHLLPNLVVAVDLFISATSVRISRANCLVKPSVASRLWADCIRLQATPPAFRQPLR